MKIILCLFLGFFIITNINAETLFCSHPEVCHLLTHSEPNNFELKSLITITGDPHEYEPTTEEIKLLLTVNPLITGPLELHPWIKKILYQRTKNKSLITFTLNFEANILKKYPNATKEALSHFWLYPNIYCDFQKQVINLKLSKLKKSCDSKVIDELIIKKIKNITKPIILTHDALVPFFYFYDNDKKLQLLSLKGSGHHDDVSPDAIKNLYQLLNTKSVNWILESNIHIPANIQSHIRKEDNIIKIDTAKSNFSDSSKSSDEFSTIRKLLEGLK
jgi:ABC-type Zn uptake system ZnuABC Zn-binding protein ZnuA